MDIETYMMAGLKHNKKDEVVTVSQIRENQRELNSQVSMIRVGGSWGHEDRARSNMICHSEMVFNMYVLFKDHKGWQW